MSDLREEIISKYRELCEKCEEDTHKNIDEFEQLLDDLILESFQEGQYNILLSYE
jgi:hypothetical protein